MPALEPGLYIIATPIGTARDITLRALDILAGADVLVAEDTRSLRRLMEIHSIALNGRKVLAYHDHNGDRVRPGLMALLEDGKSLVYASEAGTPMVADPGYDLARIAREAGHAVISAPGPSAVIAALTVAGLPTDRFLFAGFLPSASAKRKTALRDVAGVPGTLVFYESPKRIAAALRDAAEVLGGGRQAAICRELTKKFEEVLKGTLEELAALCAARDLKGEIVLVVERGEAPKLETSDIEALVRAALGAHSVRDAADVVAGQTGRKRREIYQIALRLSEQG